MKESDLSKEYKHFRNGLGENSLYKNLVYSYFKDNIKPCRIFDYGAGTLEIAQSLKSKGYDVTAYDIDENAFKEEYSEGLTYFSDSNIFLSHLKNKKYDVVLCSLVLCCVDDSTARTIVENCKTMSTSRVVFVICNPFFTNTTSLLQIKKHKGLYSNHCMYNKTMRLTNNERREFQRNLGFYEDLFIDDGEFEIEIILQTKDTAPYGLNVGNSDFMLISLIKKGL